MKELILVAVLLTPSTGSAHLCVHSDVDPMIDLMSLHFGDPITMEGDVIRVRVVCDGSHTTSARKASGSITHDLVFSVDALYGGGAIRIKLTVFDWPRGSDLFDMQGSLKRCSDNPSVMYVRWYGQGLRVDHLNDQARLGCKRATTMGGSVLDASL